MTFPFQFVRAGAVSNSAPRRLSLLWRLRWVSEVKCTCKVNVKASRNPQTSAGGTGEIPHKALITLTAREFKYRRGLSSEDLRKDIQVQLLEKFPGIALSDEKIQ